MKAALPRREFTAALKTVLPASKAGHSGMVVLGGVLIEAAKTGVDLTCTSIDLTIGTTLDAPHSTTGRCVVGAAILARIVGAMGGETVTLDYAEKERTLTVASAETVTTLRCLDPEGWPKIPDLDGQPVTWSGEDADLLARILPMASVERNRAELCCIHLAGTAAHVTDSFRMGMVEGLPELVESLVPAEALRYVLDRTDGEVQIISDGRRARFAVGPTTWTVALVEGDYPDVARLVRGKSKHSLTFASSVLAESVARVSSLVADPKRGVEIQRDGGKAVLSSSEAEVGTIADAIACTGDFDERLRLNPQFLLQMIDAVGDEITLGLEDALKPVEVTDGRLTTLLVPVRAS